MPPTDPAAPPLAPWHEGERRLQAAAGMRERMEDRGRIVLRDHMPEQHRDFFCTREQLFVATLDAAGVPWASVIEGEAGFIGASSSKRLHIAAALPDGDPAADGLKQGAPIGAIGIDFASRRRNRVNGTITRVAGDPGFTLDVVQCFGNCPQYIQARRPMQPEPGPARQPGPSTMRRSTSFTENDIGLIRGADTCFIASRSAGPVNGPSEGLDMSHRGGRPGFVRVGDRQLTVPDYRGNYFFNTLGNILMDPRCSLLFIDFAAGTTLQVAGHARVVTDPAVVAAWPQAERAVRFDVDEVVRTERRSKLRWDFVSFAPQLDRPGA